MLVSQNKNFITDKIQTVLLNSSTIRLNNECYFPLSWSIQGTGQNRHIPHHPCSLFPPFSQGKWQNQWIAKTSVGRYQVTGTVPGSQMDPQMYKTLLFFSPSSWRLCWWDTGEKHENMNVKVIGYVMSHLKRGYFHCLFLLINYFIIKCPEVHDKCSNLSHYTSQTICIFSLLGVHPLKIK